MPSTVGLRPFFCLYGGKWRIAPRYPKPAQETIVEPFAGAAGYATRYPDHQVVLVERDPKIAALWRFLTRASVADILAIPLLEQGGSVDDLTGTSEEARHLVGFWINKGGSSPRKTASAWMRSGIRPHSFWGKSIRSRIAHQVDRIRHWRVIEGDYSSAPDVAATWFVDPPYDGRAGRHYRHQVDDYLQLSRWCRTRRGQVIACENVGATWLPFAPFHRAKANESKHGKKTSHEAIWLQTRRR